IPNRPSLTSVLRQRAVGEATRPRDEQCAVACRVEAVHVGLDSGRAGRRHAVDAESIGGGHGALLAQADALRATAPGTGVSRDVQADGGVAGGRPRIDTDAGTDPGEWSGNGV